MTSPTQDQRQLRATLARRRNEAAPFLPLWLRVHSLIDSDYCDQTSKMIAELGKWERRLATRNLANDIPNESGVYMFVWEPALTFEIANDESRHQLRWYLYVGKARETTLKARYREYAKYVQGDPETLWKRPKDTRTGLLQTFLCLRPLYYYFLEIGDGELIDEIEFKLRDLLCAPLNSSDRYTARIMPRSARPAFG